MNYRNVFLSALGSGLCLPLAGLAQQSTSPPAEAAPALHAAPVVVTATRVEQSSFDLPVSIDSIEASQIRDQQPRVNLSESLVRVPGIVAQNRQNYAQDLQISSRGFGARSTFGIRGIRLIADGIPATMPDGQGQAATFDLETAGRIEVLRGPFSAIYGNASGGVIQLFTEDGPVLPTIEAGLLAGSYGTARASAKFGGRNDALNYTAAASRFDSDGYRQHSAVTRDTGSARLRWAADADTTVTILANALHQGDTQDPLGLTRTQLQADPRQAGSGAEQFNTRKSIGHLQGGVTLERRFGAADSLTLIAYSGQRDVRQFLAFRGDGASQSGGVVDLDRGFGGVGLRWTHRARPGDMPLTFTAGIDYDNMEERRRGFVNDNGTAGTLKRDEDDRVYNLDQYGQVDWQLSPRWRFTAGLRHNLVRFRSQDHFTTGPTNPDDSGSATFEKTNPMAGLLYQWSETVNLYVNLGQGFETPTFAELAYRPGGSPGLNFALRPSVSRSAELGVKAFATPTTRINAALFNVRVRDEIVTGPTLFPGRTTFTNANRTARDGIELSVDSDLGRSFQAYLAYSLVNARFVDYVNFSGADLSGKAIPGVPRTTLYAELSWRPLKGLVTAVEVRRAGKVYAADTNADAADAYTVANWRVGLEQAGSGWRLQEFLRIDNLSDRAYVGSVIVNANGGAYFEPAPRRNFSAGVSARLAF